ncbi:MAG: AbrB/MazE/SpoVT family DNA-binding domain-containing protein [Nitrosotalea sp.]
MSNETMFTTVSSRGQIVIPNKVRKKLDIKDGNVFVITEKKGLIVLKKVDQKLSQDDIKTLKSIHEAWREIETGKGGKANTSKFFMEFAKW